MQVEANGFTQLTYLSWISSHCWPKSFRIKSMLRTKLCNQNKFDEIRDKNYFLENKFIMIGVVKLGSALTEFYFVVVIHLYFLDVIK